MRGMDMLRRGFCLGQRWRLAGSLVLAGMVATTVSARAEDDAAARAAEGSIASSLPGNGDPGGHRARLKERGVTYMLTYIGEVLGNPSGGISQGTIAEGRLEFAVDADLEKLAGWKGLAFHFHGYQIHGTGLSTKHIGNFMTVSSIEALPTTRLFELWLEQRMFDDKVSLRVGQLGADTEFFISTYATQLFNATFGWPANFGLDMPNGGPGYPFATPGARLKVDPTANLSLLAGVFNGDPAGPSNDPQRANRYNTNFRVHDPALVMGEVQYRYGQEKGAAQLAGTVRLGGWYHFGRFEDQRFGTDGLSLADPASNGIALRHRGNGGIYGVIDQQIWRPASGEPDKGVGVFARVSASPSDRNPIDFYVDGGIVFSGVVPGRPDDSFGAGIGYARFSDRARSLDRDFVASGALQPIRDHEAALEANYTAQVVPGWSLIPQLQYIWHPGGNVSDPANPARAIPDALVLGARTIVRY